jgi:hypothetical protein
MHEISLGPGQISGEDLISLTDCAFNQPRFAFTAGDATHRQGEMPGVGELAQGELKLGGGAAYLEDHEGDRWLISLLYKTECRPEDPSGDHVAVDISGEGVSEIFVENRIVKIPTM